MKNSAAEKRFWITEGENDQIEYCSLVLSQAAILKSGRVNVEKQFFQTVSSSD
jgi:hypothetical protein